MLSQRAVLMLCTALATRKGSPLRLCGIVLMPNIIFRSRLYKFRSITTTFFYMSNYRIIVVTGSNRGIGKGIVQLLAREHCKQPLAIYATSRAGFNSNIESVAPNIVLYRKLDITDQASIGTFFKAVLEEHGAVDILVNNGAVSHHRHETTDLAAQTVRTNYGGTRDMCRAFLAQPNIRPGARIVNVTSGHNRLQNYGPDPQNLFREAKTLDSLDAIAEAYLSAVRRGSDAQAQAGWGTGARSYKVSKALINALTIVLAQQYPHVLVNCGCPGWTDTVMGNEADGTPPKTPEQGAYVPTRLAIGDLGPGGNRDGGIGKDSEPFTGLFYENDSIVEPGWGRASLWLES
ncbi:hypothetical protein C7974DRAFT_381848 [Boeremia exigua]|uniref:uncharacterized protein n=1 Tax=Boeremia exigua TaxID=749465 RepID=UPI001E8D5893|nr:uncharacterized protein C7974DRAFT_381848 [Boeremia exigua]KAH6643604.1 hypothetical protein C7974DRAFT_381848 [Boeremia exigua]